ncbi:hypothetical protein LOZ39_006366 [Ophidiomyces ophidiicola]|nr:hypothetical protein LOZ61_003256 [Ophidiomyces ophidiicola]KAI1918249.1 hypothetical protein LOZ64_002823 [Ophidiomyces ophidiicola]KAI1927521.1 hypothetical protein LOZ60_002976 [Ophidiomyces ophidiicola]KAI1959257.1 hypothetical protein LOZ59_003177 [Ophidiomyces ophidiicola]KAI2014882.1 hypothetical protein LOZ49_001109 [Ophidiomyces ophidiicola]
MVLPRSTAAFRTLLSTQSKRIAPRAARSSRVWQQSSRRGYSAEGGADSHKAGSDLPWLIGSIAITAPCAYYLYKSGPSNSSHGHDHGHGHDNAAESDDSQPKEAKDTEESQEQAKPEAVATPAAEEEKAAPTSANEKSNDASEASETETEKGESKEADAPAADTKTAPADSKKPEGDSKAE